ncbi:MAG: hypothetical protein LBG67_05425 [Campylobacteraceae bacterium]|nr:hypothetical protein [Campylobacteraceae bacterium]
MNCYNHPETAAVATCADCGKSLCKECASLYTTPICSECNLERAKSNKRSAIMSCFSSVAIFVAVFAFVLFKGGGGLQPSLLPTL